MFIRFVSGEIHEYSQVSVGLFCAAYELSCSDALPEYEFDALKELQLWFNDHLDSPFDYLQQNPYYDQAVCWFKPTAHEHLAKAWELIAILERNDVLVWTIRSDRPGYVYYEDDTQIFARPFGYARVKLRA